MQEQLQVRLEELQKEYTTGQARLRELEAQQTSLAQTLLRIEGAITVIQELLKAAPAPEKGAPGTGP